MGLIDISGLNRWELLERLWRCSSPDAFFANVGLQSPGFDIEQARLYVECFGWRFDYYAGRPIHVDLGTDVVEGGRYDRVVGEGVFERVVESLRGGVG